MTSKQFSLRILYHLAATGGTVITKCLGVMKNITMLSEIHPQGSPILNVLQQAQRWHHLYEDEEWKRKYNEGKEGFKFVLSIIDIAQRVKTKGEYL